jgi:hypothetical protein
MPNTATGGLTPSQRASLHAEKAASKAYRRAATPGPGSYHTAGMATSAGARLEAKRPSSAFKSGSKRLSNVEEQMGDPGQYDAYDAIGIAATSQKSFGRSSKLGAGGFGSQSARALNQPVVDSPGPGSYNSRPIGGNLFDKTHNRAPSSAFRSSSAQRMKEHNHYTPSPGAYDVRKEAVEARVPGGLMGGKDGRFKHDKSTTHEEIGPGAYDWDAGLSADVARSVAKQSRAAAGFGTKTAQHDLPFTPSGTADGPGPGSYNSGGMATSAGARLEAKRPSSAFKSGSKRLVNVEEQIGDPGAYDAYAATEIGNVAKKSTSSLAKSGSGAFGALGPRMPKQSIDDNPGPGAYNTKGAQADSQKKMPNSAFRSSSAQRMKEHNHYTPSPGAYDVRKEAVEARVPGGLMGGKDGRFKHDKSTTHEEIGPGAYDTDNLPSGARASVAGSVHDAARRGASASFASDTIRELPGL